MHTLGKLVEHPLVFDLIGALYSLPFLPLLAKKLITTARRLPQRPAQPVPASSEVTRALIDPRWGNHRYVKANGLTFHIVEKGNPRAPLVLFLHGFPECWYTWRHQLEALGATNQYHAVAIDSRGYGWSDKPEGKEAYRLHHLIDDICALIEVLGHGGEDEKIYLCGHDWGGSQCWTTAHLLTETKIAGLIIMNCPHPKAFTANSGVLQFFRSWYIFFFQMPVLPEIYLADSNWWQVRSCLAGSMMGPKRRKMSQLDLDCYIHAFSQPGTVTAAVNYYRHKFAFSSGKLSQAVERPLEMPVLMIWGEDDAALGIELTEEMERYCKNIGLKVLSNCSHWVQNDASEEVNYLVLDFLKAHPTVR